MSPAASPRRGPEHALDARSAVRVVLATVAAFGSENAGAARAAYQAGLSSAGWALETAEPTFEPPAALRDLERLDSALSALASIRPRDKERVLRSVLATIRADAVTACRNASCSASSRARWTARCPPTSPFRRRPWMAGASRMQEQFAAGWYLLGISLRCVDQVHEATCARFDLLAPRCSRSSPQQACCCSAGHRATRRHEVCRRGEGLELFTTDEEHGIPTDILQRARGIAVIPN